MVVGKFMNVPVEAVGDCNAASLEIYGFDIPSEGFVLRSSFRSGLMMVFISRSLAATSCSIGVKRK